MGKAIPRIFPSFDDDELVETFQLLRRLAGEKTNCVCLFGIGDGRIAATSIGILSSVHQIHIFQSNPDDSYFIASDFIQANFKFVKVDLHEGDYDILIPKVLHSSPECVCDLLIWNSYLRISSAVVKLAVSGVPLLIAKSGKSPGNIFLFSGSESCTSPEIDHNIQQFSEFDQSFANSKPKLFECNAFCAKDFSCIVLNQHMQDNKAVQDNISAGSIPSFM